MNKKPKYLKLKFPLEINELCNYLVNQDNYAIGSLVLTKYKKSPRFVTKKGHYSFLEKRIEYYDNSFGYRIKRISYLWIRIS